MDIEQINIEYLSPSRTIETYSSIGKELQEPFFIYNYEGNHFRFFKDRHSLIQFFKNGIEPDYAFKNEEDLDEYLLTTL